MKRMILISKSLCAGLMLAGMVTGACAQTGNTPAATDREKTAFQTSGQWKPVTDVRSDVAIVYGANDRRDMTFEERV
ncbi:MAG: hypothetical protein LBS79_08145, partial [Tannerella sp.]|nr:hypothetical protein [Tannerella sp.]